MGRTLVRGLLVAVFLMLCGGGCIQQTSTTTNPGSIVGWSSRGVGADRATFSFSTSTASTIVIYRFALANYTLAFAHSTSVAAVSEWMKRLPEARFISNGVYFHEDQLPSGWFTSNKHMIGKRSFDLDKSALLTLQPKVDILVTPDDQKRGKERSTEAAQSFPVLISKGTAALKTDSGKASRRTFIGIDQSHTYVYIGIVPYTSISLFELSQTLARLPVQWGTVLNLDGGPSSGMFFRDETTSELIDSYVTIPNVLVVTPNP